MFKRSNVRRREQTKQKEYIYGEETTNKEIIKENR